MKSKTTIRPCELQLTQTLLSLSMLVLTMCSLSAINGSRSPACRNINFVMHKYIIRRGLITNYVSYYHIKHLLTKHIVHDTPTITIAR